MTREYHVLSLGAGVQSTAIYLMAMDGELDIKLDAAVFADVGEEPQDVYSHLGWLAAQGGPPIVIVSAGKLGDDLQHGKTPSQPNGSAYHENHRHRHASIPAFTASRPGNPEGMVQRQCTKEYKIEPIEKWIRRELLGMQPRQRIPDDVKVHQYMGFSRDEPGRAARAHLRFKQIRWGEVHFPLFDEGMTRADCVRYLEGRVPHPVPRSACVFCPFKNNREWRQLRDTDHEGWQRALRIDEALRIDGTAANRGMDQKLYIHKQCVPLADANLGDDQPDLFDMECEGGCGL
jgi:hypothetical protein